jgi:hypothetical protein
VKGDETRIASLSHDDAKIAGVLWAEGAAHSAQDLHDLVRNLDGKPRRVRAHSS